MSYKIFQLRDGRFECGVLNSYKPVLVDFLAEWCWSLKMIAPILDDIATEYGDRITVGKLNVDHNNQTPPKYNIRGIPTLLLFKNGEVAGTKVGALSKAQLAEFIEQNL